MSRPENWNEKNLRILRKKPVYDLWLDKHREVLEASAHLPILDLGCGRGNDSLYLTERGYQVVSGDISEAAVAAVKECIPAIRCMVIDMLAGLPFEDDSFSVVIADLCLHYFKWDDTVRIVHDIRRILKTGGTLLCRVNSINDVNYGAGQGTLIEENFYFVEGKTKRFFDMKQLDALFSGWDKLYVQECRLERFGLPKMLWEVAVGKQAQPKHT